MDFSQAAVQLRMLSLPYIFFQTFKLSFFCSQFRSLIACYSYKTFSKKPCRFPQSAHLHLLYIIQGFAEAVQARRIHIVMVALMRKSDTRAATKHRNGNGSKVQGAETPGFSLHWCIQTNHLHCVCSLCQFSLWHVLSTNGIFLPYVSHTQTHQ